MKNRKLTGLALIKSIALNSLKMGIGAFIFVETIIAFLRGLFILNNPMVVNGFSNQPTGWLYIILASLIIVISIAYLVVKIKGKDKN